MCGIAGYVGPKNAVDVVFDQLKRLEYRGYDSAGIAYLDNGSIAVTKKAGKLSELGKVLFDAPKHADLAIAHSRWATHGGPTDENAHPHYDRFERIAIIHNVPDVGISASGPVPQEAILSAENTSGTTVYAPPLRLYRM